MQAADRVERGRAAPAGPRPRAAARQLGRRRPPEGTADGRAASLIAKFSSSTDTYAVVKGEFAAMDLARRAGLDVAGVELVRVMGRDVLLVERFDRVPGTRQRRAMVSALTILGARRDDGPLRELRRPRTIVRERSPTHAPRCANSSPASRSTSSSATATTTPATTPPSGMASGSRSRPPTTSARSRVAAVRPARR